MDKMDKMAEDEIEFSVLDPIEDQKQVVANSAVNFAKTEYEILYTKAYLKYKFRDYEQARMFCEQAIDKATTVEQAEKLIKLSTQIQKEFKESKEKTTEKTTSNSLEINTSIKNYITVYAQNYYKDIMTSIKTKKPLEVKKLEYFDKNITLQNKDQLNKENPFNRDDFTIIGDALFMSGVFKKIHNEERWNNLYIFNEDLKYGQFTFTIKILESTTDNSLVFGFFDASFKDPKYENFKNNVIGLSNQKGLYMNTDFVKNNYELKKNSEISCVINFNNQKIVYLMGNKTLAYTNNLNLLKSGCTRFGIFNRSGKNEFEFVGVKRKFQSPMIKCPNLHPIKTLTALPPTFQERENLACALCGKVVGTNFGPENFLYNCGWCESIACKACFELKWKSILFDKVSDSNHLETLHPLHHYNFYVSGDSDFVDRVFQKSSDEIHIYDQYYLLEEITEGIWEFDLQIQEYDNGQKTLYIGFVSAGVTENTLNTEEVVNKHSLVIDGNCNIVNKKDLGEIKADKYYTRTLAQNSTVKVRLNMNSYVLYFDVDGTEVVTAYTHFQQDKFKKLKFCIFNSSRKNKVKLLGIKNNLYHSYSFSSQDFRPYGETTYKDGVINCNKFLQDFAVFQRPLENAVWKFQFEVEALKNSANLSVAVRERDTSKQSSPTVDELKNELFGLNINNNKNFCKINGLKKIKVKDVITVIVNHLKVRTIDYLLNGEPLLKSKGAKLQGKKSWELVVLGDKENYLKLTSVYTSEVLQNQSNKPDKHYLFCNANHEIVKFDTFPKHYSEMGYVGCDYCERYITSKGGKVANPEIFWYRCYEDCNADMCPECYEMETKKYYEQVKSYGLKMNFRGFGRWAETDKVVSKVGVNSWDSLIYSDVLLADYFKVKLKILKMKDKDPSGVVVGLLKEDNLEYGNQHMKDHVAISGKGSKYTFNTLKKIDYTFKSKDKVLIEFNKLRKKVWFYLNGCLVAESNIDTSVNYRFGIWIYYPDTEIRIEDYQFY